MTIASKNTAAALFALALVGLPQAPASAQSMNLAAPMAGSTMVFADRFATAYYLVDKADFKTVVTVAPGPDGQGNPMQFTNWLSDGERAAYSIGGYGKNAIKTTLHLVRLGDTVQANVTTETPPLTN